MSADELLEVKPEFMGFHDGEYPGAFPPKVIHRIRTIAASPSLHLFSGSSDFGDVRVDWASKRATVNADVFEFIKSQGARKPWAFVILDRPYALSARNIEQMEYPVHDTFLWSSKQKRDAFEAFLQEFADNILWFDACAPRPSGFYRYRSWLYLKGGYTTVRVLSWLKREGERLEATNSTIGGMAAAEEGRA